MASWDIDMVLMVRSLIGDMVEPFKYSDERIGTSIVTGGILSTTEYNGFANIYTFTFSPDSITPDPTSEPIAMALFSLKAACLLSINNYQAGIGRNVAIKDGTSSVDLKGSFQGYKDILTLGPCGAYDKLIASLERNTVMSGNVGGAVFSPYSPGNGTGWAGFNTNGHWYSTGFWDSFCF